MNALTLEVILRVVFGVTDERRLAALRPRVNATVDVSPAVLLGWGWPWLQRFDPWKAPIANQHELDRLMYAEIRERRAAPDLADRTDVLSRLIRIGRRRRRPDRRGAPRPAGHPAARRARDDRDRAGVGALRGRPRPRAAPRARAPPPTEGDDAWLEAVLKESMRLHPVIPMVVRTLMKPATVGGIDLPAGATIGPSILLAHAREENHPDPEVFRPGRFLGQNPPTNTWIPFGGGVRRCIGAGFSLMEGVAVLREVFTAYDVTTVGDDVPEGPQHHQRPQGRRADPGGRAPPEP